jgi:hypothetical protein
MNFNNQRRVNKPSVNDYEIHWWQFPLSKLSIRLDKKFKIEFFSEVYKQRSKSLELARYINKRSVVYGKALNFAKQRALLWEYKERMDFIPAWIIYELAGYLKKDLLEIEKNIVAYSSYYGRIKITSPNLPILVTPLFSSLLLHMICDGTVSDKHMFYFQKNKEHLDRFIRIVKN